MRMQMMPHGFNYRFVRAMAWAMVLVGIYLVSRSDESTQRRVGVAVFVAILTTLVGYTIHFLRVYRNTSKVREQIILTTRAARTRYFVLGVLSTCICVLLTLVFLVKRQLPEQPAIGIEVVALFIGVAFTWVGAYELRIYADALEYWSLFGGCQTVTFNEIERGHIKTAIDSSKPTFRLEIMPVHDSAKKPIIINLKAFRESDIRRMFEWFGDKLDGPRSLSFFR